MSRHSFDPAIAELAGINAAVIYQNIIWWCEKNAANKRNIHDGRSWTYNSMTAFDVLFPYLSRKQIRSAIDKLKSCDLILVGNFNKDPRDKTNWYSQKGTLHLPSGANGRAPEGQPLPVSKPVINNTPNPQGGDDGLFSDNEDQTAPDRTAELIADGFNEFFDDIWPKHQRKGQRADCLKVYSQAVLGKHPKSDAIAPAAINNATRRYVASVTDKQFLKGTLPWLRQPGWEAFLDGPDALGADWSTISKNKRSLLEKGICPPSMLDADGKPNKTAIELYRTLEISKTQELIHAK